MISIHNSGVLKHKNIYIVNAIIKNSMQQPYCLNFFIDYWKKALDKSSEIIFERNIGTISYYFLEQLETKAKKNKHNTRYRSIEIVEHIAKYYSKQWS